MCNLAQLKQILNARWQQCGNNNLESKWEVEENPYNN